MPPDKVDLRKDCSPVRDQGDLAASTAFATTACFKGTPTLFGKPVREADLKVLWAYYNDVRLADLMAQEGGEGSVGEYLAKALRDLGPPKQD